MLYKDLDNTYPFQSKKATSKKSDVNSNLSLDILGSKVPPHSKDAEIAVLGAMMLDESAIAKVIEILDPESMYSEAHRIIFETMLEMFKNKINVDIVTLSQELLKNKCLDLVGGSFYLSEINSKTPTSANVEHHARIVQEKYLKRMLINASGNILSRCYDDGTDALEEIDFAEREIFKLSDKRWHKSYVKIKTLAHQTLDLIAEHLERDKKGMLGIPSGFKELDKYLGGFQNSDFIVIAGRPSMGKTSLALSIARNIAVEFKKRVAFFSLEMAAVQLVIRLLSAEAKVNSNDIRVGRITEDDFKKIAHSIGRIADAPIIIDDSPSLSIMEFRAKTRRLIVEHQIQIVIVDYLQFMRASKAESREREISMISQSFKQVAKELNIPIIALAQLNRSVETRSEKNKRPLLSDLRESGSIEQDADVVLFIHRPEYYKIETYEDNQPTKGTAEIIIGKQRNGPTGIARVAYIEDYSRFENLSFQYNDQDAPF